jgi:hypothetical protein
MNPPDLDRLLRAAPPAPAPAPDLEARICAAVHATRRAPRFARPLAACTAAAALSLLALAWLAKDRHQQAPPAAVAAPPPPAPLPPPLPANPLRAEAEALSHDAGRTGRFLLECLPSLAGR